MELFEAHRGVVEFFVVYIREAHATDSPWPMSDPDSPIVEEPADALERLAVAQRCMAALALRPMPALVDGLDDAVDEAYEAWPDRLYLIDRDGRVAYRGPPGPFGFKPDELADAIDRELSGRDGSSPARDQNP
jgi:type I thyroxine 5'-deiodinase